MNATTENLQRLNSLTGKMLLSDNGELSHFTGFTTKQVWFKKSIFHKKIIITVVDKLNFVYPKGTELVPSSIDAYDMYLGSMERGHKRFLKAHQEFKAFNIL